MSNIGDDVDQYIALVIKLMDASVKYWPRLRQAMETTGAQEKEEPTTPSFSRKPIFPP
jgi:hypothetical protein